MDINKFKSVAVRKPDYDLLQGLCNAKFRSPASMISKLVNEYCEFQAGKNKMTVETYKQKILINIKPTKQKKARNGHARR
jgi:hypothetical protein|tara:strand:+ start:999 stop:1238 length:240 start_codon:yes stop_codon:yes gene_type:complete